MEKIYLNNLKPEKQRELIDFWRRNGKWELLEAVVDGEQIVIGEYYKLLEVHIA